MSLEETTAQQLLTLLQDLKTTVEEVKEAVVKPDPPVFDKEHFPNWEEPKKIEFPSESKNPLQGDNNGRDNDEGDPKVFIAKGTGQGRTSA